MSFTGFTKEGISFLKDLTSNNNKEWFEEHRCIYEEHLLKPLKQLTTDLGLLIKSIDLNIETAPVINKTISKIYRDTRFSNDKSPFKTNLWISFKRPVKVWGNVPEFYFYFTPSEYQYGMGFYSATPGNMQKIKEYIVSFPDRFKEIMDYYSSQNTFALVGDEYKKRISNPLSPEYQKWFQKRNLCMSCENKIDETFFSTHLKEVVEKAFNVNAKLYHFLTESINQ